MILVVAMSKHTSSENLSIIIRFLKLVLGANGDSATKIPKSIIRHCRSMLLPEMFAYLPASATTVKDVPYATRGTALSMIAILRYFLLFIVAGSNPVPANGMDLRDKLHSKI